MRLGLGLGLTRFGGGEFVPQLRSLSLTALTVDEDVATGTVVGALTNTQIGSTFALLDDAGGRFALDGTNIETDTLTDVATDTTYNIVIEETNGAYPNSPRESTITITVLAAAFPANALFLNSQVLTLNGQTLTLGA